MNVEEYQKKAHLTAVYPQHSLHLTPAQIYTSLGLLNEAGELAGVIKKGQRGDYGVHPTHSEKFINKLRGEIGDVCWYLAEICTAFGFDLIEVMEENINKLNSRKKRGVLQGDGDER